MGLVIQLIHDPHTCKPIHSQQSELSIQCEHKGVMGRALPSCVSAALASTQASKWTERLYTTQHTHMHSNLHLPPPPPTAQCSLPPDKLVCQALPAPLMAPFAQPFHCCRAEWTTALWTFQRGKAFYFVPLKGIHCGLSASCQPHTHTLNTALRISEGGKHKQ